MEGFIKITATPENETTTHLECQTDLKQVNKMDKAKLLQLFMKATEMDPGEALYLMFMARRMESEQEAEEDAAEASAPDEPSAEESTCQCSVARHSDPNIGKYCIIRGDRSGVFAGTLVSQEGQKVVLHNVRRLWCWNGAASISQIATEGVTKPRDCKFTVTVDSITILDAIEIIPTTAEAEANINAVPVWKM